MKIETNILKIASKLSKDGITLKISPYSPFDYEANSVIIELSTNDGKYHRYILANEDIENVADELLNTQFATIINQMVIKTFPNTKYAKSLKL